MSDSMSVTSITLRVLDGADRGRVFENLHTPITIGREEGNSIQLNDERVSRFHVKIQDDHERLVLTDLESTNGTKVNGEDIQLRILKFGDMIAVGRSVLLFGTREQIQDRLSKMKGDSARGGTLKPDEGSAGSSYDFELNWVSDSSEMSRPMHGLEPPELPERLTPGQAAQFAELLEYIRIRIRNLLGSVQVDSRSEHVEISVRQWQYLVDLQSRLAEYLRAIGDPGR